MTIDSREELARALAHIDPDLPRDEWIAVLMGLHTQGEEALARDWSAQGSKWDERAFESAWRSFHANGNGHQKVTVASVFHVAKQYGYKPPKHRPVRVRCTGVLNKAHAPSAASQPVALPVALPVVLQQTSGPADTSFSRFARGSDASAHPYVVKKRMGAQHLRVIETWDGKLELAALFVNVATDAPATIQVIDASGQRKRNWPGHSLAGAAWRVRGDRALVGDETVFVAEGIATAWACLQATGSDTHEAFATAGKGNLRTVADALRRRWPALDIVLVADRDAVKAATTAARACAGRAAVIPDERVPGNPTADAWDVWDVHGPAVLAAMLDAAQACGTQTSSAAEGAARVGIAAILDNLRADEALAGLLGFDCMRGRIVLLKARPWPSASPGWTDNDVVNVEVRITERGIPAGFESVGRACRMLAEENPIHPVCRWLDGLRWDGVHRVDAWLTTHLGAEDSAYAREVGRVLLLSMVARARMPGCKADCMVILEGRQGANKSATLATLGGEWFSDCAPDLENLRASGEALRGIWLLECSEITALRRHEVEAQKAFLSRRIDSYRPAYGHQVIDQPRQCIVVGTTNHLDGYLADDSGNRRFLPVRVGWCDIAAVERDRDQLFAEADARIAGGETWWIEGGALLAAAAKQAEERAMDNPWLERVRAHVTRPAARAAASDPAKLPALTIPAVFEVLTGHAYESRNLVDGRLIAAALRELGYVKRIREGTRVYVRDGALDGAL